jgi:hypothetical protein
MKVLMILGKVIEVIVTEMADSKSVIVSDYSGSYESIHTTGCRSLLLLKVAKYLQGYKPWGMNSNVNFEWFDPTKDQVTYHSPWSNFN